MPKARRVFLCEKPSTARLIADVLGKKGSLKGGIDMGDEGIATYAFGHLLEPISPEGYDESLKRWAWDSLPIIPPQFRLKPKDSKASEQIGHVRRLLADANEVVMATDADREGELIGYQLLAWCKWKGPTRRLWLSDLTPPAIKKALLRLRPIEETTPYALAAQARQQADWLVGMNLTRAATLKMRENESSNLVSIGRVQTPTLALIVRREREIRTFKPEPYFDIVADVQSENGTILKMRPDNSVEKPKTRQQADALISQIRGGRGKFEVETEAKTRKPPKLLDLDTLQQQCNTLFGMTSDATLKAAQSLYEEHRLLTYPRTDCRFLPEEQKPLAPEILKNIFKLFSDKELSGFDVAKARTTTNTYNDRKITAHHAIVPTLQPLQNLGSLSESERNVYMLVARYFVAAHMDDHEYESTALTIEIGSIPLITRGKKTIVIGWRGLFERLDENEEDEVELPKIVSGDEGQVVDVTSEEKQTQPPSRYTEATLLKAMKNVAQLIEDPKLKEALKNAAGIGTPATRANIIETLKRRNFVKLAKKALTPTDLGMDVITVVERIVPHYADPTVTARWENDLEGIVSRGCDPRAFMNDITSIIRSDIDTLKSGSIGTISSAGQSPKKSHQKPRPAPKGVTFLNVPYDKRDEAKSLGARWDGTKKKWYIPPGTDTEPFSKSGFLN